jgi:antitoxin component YwqK of YwqJK toxin-antitoxin module
MKFTLFFCSLFILIGCNSNDVNDKSKRNANWEWWVDAATGKGKWVKLGDGPSTLKNGIFTTFYFNGEKCEEGRKVDGKRVDTLFAYDLKGQPDFYEIYPADTQLYIIHNGYRKVYYRDGNLFAESNVKNHTYNGILKHYYENGRIEFIRNYIKDSGWSKGYYENGQIKDSSIEFNNTGKGRTYKTWFENGQVKSFVNWDIKTGLQNGLTLFYNESGILTDSVYFNEGKRNGIVKKWFDSGQLSYKMIYKEDVLLYEADYNEEGNLTMDTTYNSN